MAPHGAWQISTAALKKQNSKKIPKPRKIANHCAIFLGLGTCGSAEICIPQHTIFLAVVVNRGKSAICPLVTTQRNYAGMRTHFLYFHGVPTPRKIVAALFRIGSCCNFPRCGAWTFRRLVRARARPVRHFPYFAIFRGVVP